jgi:predicted ATPase/Tfp pilus assembly protein PilF
VGKTRLAIEVASRLQGTYPDGVVFVSLAPVQDMLALPTTLTRALGMSEQAGSGVTEALADFIGQRQLLVVLDNCEHLIEACAQLAASLLGTCPQLCVLATSRMALRIRGEQVVQLEPLTLPAVAVGVPLTAIERSPAVALFVERAQEAYPDFALDMSNAAEVAAICSRVDGLPLAIELAAVQCAYASPRALLARLTPSLPLLHGGSRDLPARQQTLRNAIDWSYNLLSDEARHVFRCVAVCVGGCSVDCAAALAGLEPADGIAVLHVLETLVGASLLLIVESPDGEPRFSMLETIRDYGLEKLEDSGDGPSVRARHLGWCVALAEDAAEELSGAAQGQWLDRLEVEHTNLQAALSYASPLDELGLRLALALWRFWYTRGFLTDGRRWLEAAVAAEVGSASTRARALHGAGMLAWRQGDYAQARTWHEESLALWQGMGDRHGLATSLESLGMVAWRQSDYAQARALHEQSLALRRELGDPQGTASSLHNLGAALHVHGEYEQAEAVYRESLAIRRQLGDKQGVATSLNSLGLLMGELGDYDQASPLHVESHALAEELRDKKGIANSLTNLAYISEVRREYDHAQRLHEKSLAIMRELGDRQGIANSLNQLGRIAHAQGNYEQAQVLLQEGLEGARSIGATVHVVESIEVLAGLAATLGELPRAARLYGAAVALRRAIGAPLPLRERPGHERAVTALRKRLGARRFAQAWTAGERLSLDQVVAEGRR